MSGSIYRTVLEQCLRGEPWSRELFSHLRVPELFSVLAEGLSDRFEPRLVDTYADIFCEVIAAVRPELNGAELRARYERVRRTRPFAGPEPSTVFVLSRVTLGADVAITSVLFDALKRRFPAAEILFVAPRKSYDLFAADPRIFHLAVSYGGSLEERLRAPWLEQPNAIVVDPDSRLSQLGLLPVCPEDRYCFFESRSYGGDGDEPLSALANEGPALLERTLDRFLPYRLSVASNAVSTRISQSYRKRFGLKIPEWRLIAILAEHDSMTPQDIGQAGELDRIVDEFRLDSGFEAEARREHGGAGQMRPVEIEMVHLGAGEGCRGAGNIDAQHIAARRGDRRASGPAQTAGIKEAGVDLVRFEVRLAVGELHVGHEARILQRQVPGNSRIGQRRGNRQIAVIGGAIAIGGQYAKNFTG